MMFGKQRDPQVEPIVQLDVAALRRAGASVEVIDEKIADARRMASYSQACADRERNPRLRDAFLENRRQLMADVDQLLDLRIEVAS